MLYLFSLLIGVLGSSSLPLKVEIATTNHSYQEECVVGLDYQFPHNQSFHATNFHSIKVTSSYLPAFDCYYTVDDYLLYGSLNESVVNSSISKEVQPAKEEKSFDYKLPISIVVGFAVGMALGSDLLKGFFTNLNTVYLTAKSAKLRKSMVETRILTGILTDKKNKKKRKTSSKGNSSLASSNEVISTKDRQILEEKLKLIVSQEAQRVIDKILKRQKEMKNLKENNKKLQQKYNKEHHEWEKKKSQQNNKIQKVIQQRDEKMKYAEKMEKEKNKADQKLNKLTIEKKELKNKYDNLWNEHESTKIASEKWQKKAENGQVKIRKIKQEKNNQVKLYKKLQKQKEQLEENNQTLTEQNVILTKKYNLLVSQKKKQNKICTQQRSNIELDKITQESLNMALKNAYENINQGKQDRYKLGKQNKKLEQQLQEALNQNKKLQEAIQQAMLINPVFNSSVNNNNSFIVVPTHNISQVNLHQPAAMMNIHPNNYNLSQMNLSDSPSKVNKEN